MCQDNILVGCFAGRKRLWGHRWNRYKSWKVWMNDFWVLNLDGNNDWCSIWDGWLCVDYWNLYSRSFRLFLNLYWRWNWFHFERWNNFNWLHHLYRLLRYSYWLVLDWWWDCFCIFAIFKDTFLNLFLGKCYFLSILTTLKNQYQLIIFSVKSVEISCQPKIVGIMKDIAQISNYTLNIFWRHGLVCLNIDAVDGKKLEELSEAHALP